MADARKLILTASEARIEHAAQMHLPALDEFVSSLGQSFDDFLQPGWGRAFRAWAVSHVALFRAGAFAEHPKRDPGASAMYWMVRFLLHRYAGEDPMQFIAGPRESILAVAKDPDAAREAEHLARSLWSPEERPTRRSTG